MTRSGRSSLGEPHRGLAVAGLAADVEALLLEHLAEVEADERLVLGEQDPRRRRCRGRPGPGRARPGGRTAAPDGPGAGTRRRAAGSASGIVGTSGAGRSGGRTLPGEPGRRGSDAVRAVASRAPPPSRNRQTHGAQTTDSVGSNPTGGTPPSAPADRQTAARPPGGRAGPAPAPAPCARTSSTCEPATRASRVAGRGRSRRTASRSITRATSTAGPAAGVVGSLMSRTTRGPGGGHGRRGGRRTRSGRPGAPVRTTPRVHLSPGRTDRWTECDQYPIVRGTTPTGRASPDRVTGQGRPRTKPLRTGPVRTPGCPAPGRPELCPSTTCWT